MAIHRFVSHNSWLREAGDAMLSPGQLGLLSGWGVFSTLRVVDGVLFAWERHWARMTRDAELMRVPMPEDPRAVHKDLLDLIEANHAFQATLRLVVVRNGGGMWEGPSTGRPSDVIALTANTNQWGSSVGLCYQPEGRHSRSDFSRAKILSWAGNLTWHERAHEQGFDECILLNERGHVTECTSANIFMVRGNQVWTAPVSEGCLPGITREVLLGDIRAPGIEIGERTIEPAGLESADEVFITSTTRGVLPVARIEDRHINETGEVTRKLSTEFRKYVETYVAANRAEERVTG